MIQTAAELINYIDKRCDMLKKFEKPLNLSEAEELIKKFGYVRTKEQLLNLENYPKSNKKYRSVYFTILKWFSLDEKKGFNAKISPSVEKNTVENEKRTQDISNKVIDFLKKYPVGSKFKDKSGNIYKVENENMLQNIQTGRFLPIYQLITRGF
jgi:hypothetical protein